MNEIILNDKNLDKVIEKIIDLCKNNNSYKLIIKESKHSRSINQNKLSHMWYAELSNYLISAGREFATPEWVKLAMKNTFLGYERKTYINVVTGSKKTVEQLKKTSELQTNEMHHYLTQIESWAVNIGCLLTIPDDSEYMKLKDIQNE